MASKGIILMAFGKHAYAKMAFNMAVSIRYHNPDLPITLVHDGICDTVFLPWMWQFFSEVKPLKREHLYDYTGNKEKMNPGKAKTFIYEYLSYDHNVYLDSDGACIKSLDKLFNTCIESGAPYKSQVVGWYSRDKGDDFPEMQWAWPKDIWEHYTLPEGAKMPAINSSFCYIHKCKEAEALYKQIQENILNPIPLDKLRLQWGGNQPDELYTNIALGQKGIDCDLGYHTIYFNVRLEQNWTYVEEHYDIIGLFGGVGFTHRSILDYYDRLMRKYCNSGGFEHYFKTHMFMPGKHANIRPLNRL